MEARIRAPMRPVRSLLPCRKPVILWKPGEKAMRARLVGEKDNAALKQMAKAGRRIGVHLLLGSMVLQMRRATRRSTARFCSDPDGAVAAQYDKIHMFDVTLAEWRNPCRKCQLSRRC